MTKPQVPPAHFSQLVSPAGIAPPSRLLPPACPDLFARQRCIDWRTIAIYWGNRVLSANLSSFQPPLLSPTVLCGGPHPSDNPDSATKTVALDPFVATVQELMGWAQTQVLAETDCKQLRYHNFNHALAVHRRAMALFDALEGHWQPDQDPARSRALIELCALSHDMVQEFVPSQSRDRGRQRIAGVSETATFTKLSHYMAEVNQRQAGPPIFTPQDIALVEAAIAATVCAYDSNSRTLHQPRLYDRHPPLPLAARLLALADLGSLAMDGIEAFREEGRLLFLEENLDLIHLLSGQPAPAQPPIAKAGETMPGETMPGETMPGETMPGETIPGETIPGEPIAPPPTVAEELLRQRLLKWSRLQVDFAKGRLGCCDQELAGLPASAQPWVRQQLFRHLNEGTIAHIEANYPQAEDTSLATLVHFFQMDQPLA